MIKHINEIEFQTMVLESNEVVAVDFYAEWCGPCKMLSPVLDQIQEEHPEVTILKVDIDKNLELARKYNITTVPTIKLFENGKVIDTQVGIIPRDVLYNMLTGDRQVK